MIRRDNKVNVLRDITFAIDLGIENAFVQRVLRKIDHAAEADFHRAVAQGLFDSIIHAGNGQSPESAWTAYREKEAYEILKAKQARFMSQSVNKEGNRTFDVLDAERVVDGAKLRFYFDITELMAERARAAH